MWSRREFSTTALSAAMLPWGRTASQTPPKDRATVRGVKIGAITGVYGPFPAPAGQDVIDVVIEIGRAHV